MLRLISIRRYAKLGACHAHGYGAILPSFATCGPCVVAQGSPHRRPEALLNASLGTSCCESQHKPTGDGAPRLGIAAEARFL
jgi:hypothetical protein